MKEKLKEKTILKSNYIESLEVNKDGSRWGFATSINPKTFGEIGFKIQEPGQNHKTTEYREI